MITQRKRESEVIGERLKEKNLLLVGKDQKPIEE
jgi:hypothetical protein